MEHSDSLVPRQHIHQHYTTELVVTTVAEINASGSQIVVDDDYYLPAVGVRRGSPAQQMLSAALLLANHDEENPPFGPDSVPSASPSQGQEIKRANAPF